MSHSTENCCFESRDGLSHLILENRSSRRQFMSTKSVIELTSEQRGQILESLRQVYSDFAEFPLIVDKLTQAILETDGVIIDRRTEKKIAEKYFDKKDFQTEESSSTFKKIQQIFKSAYLLVLYSREMAKQKANPKKNPAEEIIWVSIDTFLNEYPEFYGVSLAEQLLLFNFRNMAKVATLFIDPRLAKQQILNIAGRLEGSQCTYITGGGQRDEVTNRVIIYEREGGVSAEPRPERIYRKNRKNRLAIEAAKVAAAPSKRKASVVSISSSGSGSDSEAPKKRRGAPKTTKRAKIVEWENEVTPRSHSPSISASDRRPTARASRTAARQAAVVKEEDFGLLLFPADWTSASKIVEEWQLPREDLFLSTVLLGDVFDSPDPL